MKIAFHPRQRLFPILLSNGLSSDAKLADGSCLTNAITSFGTLYDSIHGYLPTSFYGFRNFLHPLQLVLFESCSRHTLFQFTLKYQIKTRLVHINKDPITF